MPARKFGHEIAAFWLSEYHLDGYRLDATAVLDNFDFVREVRAIAHERSGGKPVFVVAEQLPENPAIAGPDGPADGAWHQRFEHAVVNALRDVNEDSIAELNDTLQPANSGYANPELVVNYVESHDEQTLMHVLAQDGVFGAAAFRKHWLAATFLFTAVGIPMLYQGQEFGGHRIRSLEVRPLQWDLLDQNYGLHLKQHYASLIKIRKDYPVLAGAELSMLDAGEARGLVAYRRGVGEDEVIVVTNVLDVDSEFELPFASGTWREITYGYDKMVDNGMLADSIPASGAKIYVHSRPEPD
jgi:1,4-alpha-glucan branching enzyme